MCNECLRNLAGCVGMMRCSSASVKKLCFPVQPMVSEERVFAAFRSFVFFGYFSPSN